MSTLRHKTRWQTLSMCLLLAVTGKLSAANGGSEVHRISAIKAAFVLNIARFVTWPEEVFASDEASLDLCLYRSNVYGQVIESLQGEKIGKHRVDITTIEQLAPDDGCEILLIPPGEMQQFNAEVEGKLARPLLTIADHTEDGVAGISRLGILVTLVRQGTRIGFEIDPWQAREVNLHMSSELLKLARIVGGGS